MPPQKGRHAGRILHEERIQVLQNIFMSRGLSEFGNGSPLGGGSPSDAGVLFSAQRDSRFVHPVRLLRGLKLLLFGFGSLALAYCVWVALAAAVYQSHSRQTLQSMRARYLSGSRSHPISAPAVGSPLADLSVPSIGLNVAVLEGDDAHTLRLGAGHQVDTSLPGEGGNVVIAGHRDTFFRPLRRVRVGDEIDLASPDGTARYQVMWTRVVQPTDTKPLEPSHQAVLTLITCYPFTYIGSAPDRFIVRARRLEQTPASGSRVPLSVVQ
jgi:sortase A